MNEVCGLLAFGVSSEQKKAVMAELKRHGVIYERFTGKLMLDVKHNDIARIDRTDKIGLLAVTLGDESKRSIIDILRNIKIIYADFIGRLLFNINQGGLTSLDRTDTIK